MPTQGMATCAARFLVLCLPVAVLAAEDARCTTTPLVSAANVYTASSDPANKDNKVNCYWLDRTKHNCADYAHFAPEGEWAGKTRKCVDHASTPQRCSQDDATAVVCECDDLSLRVSSTNVYQPDSTPANTANVVNCYWLDRSKHSCADFGHVATYAWLGVGVRVGFTPTLTSGPNPNPHP